MVVTRNSLETHREARRKVQDVYLAIQTTGTYYNSRSEWGFTYKTPDGKIERRYADPMSLSAVLNALVPKGGVIYRGGHGGGKTTLMEKATYMLTGVSEQEIADAMIRGNDDQNVNTLLASLAFGKLMTSGEEEVRWRKFVTSPVKIVDELNRFPPPAQNALFEILNKGRAAFLDETYSLGDFVLMATENPNDPGTYKLSRPFVDRFGMAVPAPQIPSAADQYSLLHRPDEKLYGIKVEPKINWEQLQQVRKMISDEVRLSPESELYLIYLTEAMASCVRGDHNDKAHSEIEIPDRCKGCHFDTGRSVCQMTKGGISGRAALDLQRYAKASAWFWGAFTDESHPEVQPEIIRSVAPYIIYHRVDPVEAMLSRDPFYGATFKYAQQIVESGSQGFAAVRDVLAEEVPQVLSGQRKLSDAQRLQAAANADLVVQTHFLPLVEEADNPQFRQTYDLLQREIGMEDLYKVEHLLRLETSLRPQAQAYLLQKVTDKKNEVNGNGNRR